MPECQDNLDSWKEIAEGIIKPDWDFRDKCVRFKGKVIGSVKQVIPKSGAERVAVYCRLHQCSPPLKAPEKAPSNELMMTWFQDGLDIPNTEAGRKLHIQMYKELCD